MKTPKTTREGASGGAGGIANAIWAIPVAGIEGRGADDEAAAIIRGDVSEEKARVGHARMSSKKAPLVRNPFAMPLRETYSAPSGAIAGRSLSFSLRKIVKETFGESCSYLPQEGRGIGLLNKIEELTEKAAGRRASTRVEANREARSSRTDSRDYEFCSGGTERRWGFIVCGLLLSNNPDKIRAVMNARGFAWWSGLPCRRGRAIIQKNI